MQLVSVICVCYNEKPYRIRETLKSIVDQDYPEIDLIIIDGGSGKDTLQAINEFKESISVLISEPDNGIFHAMNKGILISRGEWILFLNIGDSFFSSNSVSCLLTKATAEDDIIYGDVFKKHMGLKRSPRSVTGYVLYNSGICHQALIARRSLFDKVGLFNIEYKLCADPEWIHRAYNIGAVFKYIPVTICNYAGQGASSDYKQRKYYFSLFHLKNYTQLERAIYGSLTFCKKFITRLATLNFKTPISIKNYFIK